MTPAASRPLRRAWAAADGGLGADLHRHHPVVAELHQVAVVDAEVEVGVLHRHAAVELLQLDAPQVLVGAVGEATLAVEAQVEAGAAEEGALAGGEARDQLGHLVEARLALAGGGQLVAGAGQERHALALDHVRAVGPAVPAHLPVAGVAAEKRVDRGPSRRHPRLRAKARPAARRWRRRPGRRLCRFRWRARWPTGERRREPARRPGRSEWTTGRPGGSVTNRTSSSPLDAGSPRAGAPQIGERRRAVTHRRAPEK